MKPAIFFLPYHSEEYPDMPIYRYSLIAFLVILVLMAFFQKNKRFGRYLFPAAISLFIIPFLPFRLFGVWSAIRPLKGQPVTQIHLSPSLPNWPVNLTESSVIITNPGQIDTIVGLLKATNTYFPTHPIRIWETKLTLITASHDSLSMVINKTENNGTPIYAEHGDFRKDELGNYLEKITHYTTAVFGADKAYGEIVYADKAVLFSKDNLDSIKKRFNNNLGDRYKNSKAVLNYADLKEKTFIVQGHLITPALYFRFSETNPLIQEMECSFSIEGSTDSLQLSSLHKSLEKVMPVLKHYNDSKQDEYKYKNLRITIENYTIKGGRVLGVIIKT